ncbi:MAG: hypothetical protein PHY64_07225 [Eubacteriales bacterium]|nr:hypothetical protein [Eubacteriales bacterium]
MSERLCPHCGKKLEINGSAAFCPFCGAPLNKPAPAPEDEAVQKLLRQVEEQLDPRKKHEILVKAMEEHPESLAIAEEVLFLGRLYERNPRKLDFSVIKCFLLNLYLEPETISPEQRDAMRREIFDHPDLDRCLALAENKDAFMAGYLARMSDQFIKLFIHGSSKYMHRYFGFGLESRTPKLLAYPAARMLAAVQEDDQLTGEQRTMLKRALYDAFVQQASGDTRWLYQAMQERGVTLD